MTAMSFTRGALTLAFGATLGCGGGSANPASTGNAPRPSAPQRSNRNVFTGDEVMQTGQPDAFRAIQKARPQWLLTRPTGSTSGGYDELVVYVEGNRYGTTKSLEQITATSIKEMRYLDARDAIVSADLALYGGAHRDIEWTVELDETLPPLNLDREQIKRVFVNLLDNAVQSMNQKGRLWIATRYEAKRHRAVVSVADEGMGINPDDQDKLFVPYFSRKRTGTGLGLAIVHRIITDHDGQIRAANNHPKGAVFTIELPV